MKTVVLTSLSATQNAPTSVMRPVLTLRNGISAVDLHLVHRFWKESLSLRFCVDDSPNRRKSLSFVR